MFIYPCWCQGKPITEHLFFYSPLTARLQLGLVWFLGTRSPSFGFLKASAEGGLLDFGVPPKSPPTNKRTAPDGGFLHVFPPLFDFFQVSDKGRPGCWGPPQHKKDQPKWVWLGLRK